MASSTRSTRSEDRSFVQGIAIGFALAALAIHLALSSLGNWEAAYRDFEATLPLLTRLTISTGWRVGVPIVGGALIAVLVVRRPNHVAYYIAVALAIGVATAMTWWFPSAPIWAMAGTIK